MNAIVIAPATAVPITVRPADGVPVKVVPVTVAPIRIDGVPGIPGASGISVLDVLASQAADGTVTLRFAMSNGEVHEVEFRTGGALPPGDLDLSGIAAGHGFAEAILRADRTFAGAGDGYATATASLAAWLDIAAFALVSGSASGSLAATLNLAGAAQAGSTFAGALAFTLELAGTVTARAQASGLMRLGADMTLQATAECRATSTGTVLVEVTFAGTSTGRGLASATMLAALDGASSATGRGTASGSLFLARQLAASVSGIALASGTVELAAAAFIDDFTGDAQLGDRTGWTFLFGNPATAVTSGGILRTVNTAESGWSARDTGSTDHYAQATLRTIGTNGPLLCVDVQDMDNWIGVRNSASAYSIIKKLAGTVSVVVNVGGVTPAVGDVFRMEIRGRDLTFLVNGTAYWTGSLAASELAGVTKAGIVARTAARTDWIKPWSSGKL